MKVFITGGSGLLGSNLINELQKKDIDYYAPSHKDCDIINYDILFDIIKKYKPDIIVHCAAVSKFDKFEEDPLKGFTTNIVGTSNIVNICLHLNIRLVFISTSHVFDGNKGYYSVIDPINPITKYAKSKASGEYMVSILNDFLIIRTEFCGVDFPFDIAYVDKWSSKDYIDKLAPIILQESLSTKTGIVHIGGPRRSFYELALERNINIKSGSIKNIQFKSQIPILIDTSFNE
jgi:dTDP-4-dehydrorhamnose reductase